MESSLSLKVEIENLRKVLGEKISEHREYSKQLKEHPFRKEELSLHLRRIRIEIEKITSKQRDIIQRLEKERARVVLVNNKENKRKRSEVTEKQKENAVYGNKTKSDEKGGSNVKLTNICRRSTTAKPVIQQVEFEKKSPIDQAMESIGSSMDHSEDQAKFLLCIGVVPLGLLKSIEADTKKRRKRRCVAARDPIYDWGNSVVSEH